MTIAEVKQKAVDALGNVDLSKVSLSDVGLYVQILNVVAGIKESDESFSVLKEAMDKLSDPIKFEPKPPKTLGELNA